jgi:Amt family ammonium transporter
MGSPADGIFYGGGFTLMGAQITMVLSVAAFTAIGTWIILKIIVVILGLRVTQDEEQAGLDVSQHGEKAYHV